MGVCLCLKIFLTTPACTMLSTKLVLLLVVAIQLASMVDGMGLCFGGYPACYQGGQNTCGPFCASCSRVGEFLRHMMMFDMRGFGKGTPAVFRLINPDPNAFPDKDPFPAPPAHWVVGRRKCQYSRLSAPGNTSQSLDVPRAGVNCRITTYNGTSRLHSKHQAMDI